jgi:ribosomal protein L11 methyltransferase
MNTYWQVTLVCASYDVAGLRLRFRGLGTLGVLAQPLDEHRTSLAALFESTHDRKALVGAVHQHIEDQGADISGRVRVALVTGDWGEAWPEYFVPLAVGRRLLIVPPWIERIPEGRLTLVIDPGGFGTGHHPTTAGCLEALETIVDRDLPAAALDLGTGSGILAIAAARLGVARVVAIDTDAEAVAAARENAARNGVADAVRCEVGDALEVASPACSLVLANLLAPVHLALAPRYGALVAPGGALVLGGIEAHEADEVAAAVEGAGFTGRERITRESWTTLVFR